MHFTPTKLPGAWLIAPAPVTDTRGSFTRIFCATQFANHGITLPVAQCNVSRTLAAGTLRGMHFQTAPYAEAKLVRCTHGAIHDVIIDLRPGPTCGQWKGFNLTAANQHMLFVPAGFAHGFQTLTDNAVVEYMMSAPYQPAAAAGVRWNDPAFNIAWPHPTPTMSPRDETFPDWSPPP